MHKEKCEVRQCSGNPKNLSIPSLEIGDKEIICESYTPLKAGERVTCDMKIEKVPTLPGKIDQSFVVCENKYCRFYNPNADINFYIVSA